MAMSGDSRAFGELDADDAIGVHSQQARARRPDSLGDGGGHVVTRRAGVFRHLGPSIRCDRVVV